MEVGQKIYLKPVNNRERGIRDIREYIKKVTVSKVGRKYFEVEEMNMKFDLVEMRDVSQYVAEYEVYLSKQEILDELEFKELAFKVKTIFNGYSDPKLTLEQLRRIVDIISE